MLLNKTVDTSRLFFLIFVLMLASEDRFFIIVLSSVYLLTITNTWLVYNWSKPV